MIWKTYAETWLKELKIKPEKTDNSYAPRLREKKTK